MIRRRPPTASFALWALAGLLLLTALVADAAFGRTVTLMTSRHDGLEIAEWRTLRDPSDDPAEIYGQPLPGGPERLILLPGASTATLAPLPEDASHVLLFVDEGRPPPRLRAVAVLTWSVGVGALLMALGLALAARHRRRSPVARPRA